MAYPQLISPDFGDSPNISPLAVFTEIILALVPMVAWKIPSEKYGPMVGPPSRSSLHLMISARVLKEIMFSV